LIDSRPTTVFDPARVTALLERLERMAAGDGTEMIPLSSSRDELDAIAHGINVLADELRWANARASEAKTVFLRTASHEIRTPIASILGIVDLLDRDRVGDAEHADLVGRLRANCRALLSLVANVLDLSRIEADKIALTFEPVSPLELVQEVVRSLEQDARAKGVAIRIQFEMGSAMTISTDRLRLRQILVNVVANAVKFTAPPHGEILITLGIHHAADRERLTIEVADTGIGIAPHQTAGLFEPFGQADAVARVHGGTGLGLALSRRLAEQLGGSLVLVSSEVGRGTTFRITIDAHVAVITDGNRASPADSDRARAGAPAALIGLQILLAEDNSDLRLAIGRALELEGAKLEYAVNGHEAVEATARSRFDVILMDLLMPVMNGLDATRALRAAGSRVPVVAISADATPGARTAAIDAGCNAFLCKPFDSGDLVAAIRFLRPGTESSSQPRSPAMPIAESARLQYRNAGRR
jgi:signal transduction histidine kinase/ActR/RegA family two-component response regulator